MLYQQQPCRVVVVVATSLTLSSMVIRPSGVLSPRATSKNTRGLACSQPANSERVTTCCRLPYNTMHCTALRYAFNGESSYHKELLRCVDVEAVLLQRGAVSCMGIEDQTVWVSTVWQAGNSGDVADSRGWVGQVVADSSSWSLLQPQWPPCWDH